MRFILASFLIKSTKKPSRKRLGYNAWQLVIFTMARIAIVTTKMLNFCVRNGYRCVHLAIITRLLKVNPSKLNNRFFSPKTYS